MLINILHSIGYIGHWFMYHISNSFNYHYADMLVDEERKALESACTENQILKDYDDRLTEI